jgi:hypothetical protein
MASAISKEDAEELVGSKLFKKFYTDMIKDQ